MPSINQGEPIHETMYEALNWVMENTDHTVLRDGVDPNVIVRIDGNSGQVMFLRKTITTHKWYWSTMRRVHV